MHSQKLLWWRYVLPVPGVGSFTNLVRRTCTNHSFYIQAAVRINRHAPCCISILRISLRQQCNAIPTYWWYLYGMLYRVRSIVAERRRVGAAQCRRSEVGKSVSAHRYPKRGNGKKMKQMGRKIEHKSQIEGNFQFAADLRMQVLRWTPIYETE